ncbi:MAG: hydroxymethylglutaryl-CoA lyase [Gammaproteobacteria bacterium]|nr:hydroxymethylglutaryl-CoA lyase [Gammaproteobacteria bacterium]
MGERVEIVEVGPRDGLQAQPQLLDTEAKLALIERLLDAGVRRLEVASFVNPKRVPQMADADAIIARLPRRAGVNYIGLVLNEQGLDRALASGVEQINCAAVTTDSFCLRNQGKTAADMLDLIASLARRAQDAGRFFGVTIAASFGCPFEGEVAPATVVAIAARLHAMGVDEIALADTIGVAVPSDVKRLIEAVRPHIGATPLRMHFHNTRGTGIGNVYAAVDSGVRIIDASCGGVGGCPFAPGATGNVGTEDVLYLLHRMGFETGIDIAKVVATSKWLEGPLQAPMQASMSRASVFPPPRAA